MSPDDIKLVFWGVRGSIPTLDRGMWRYGGNTPCVEMTAPDGTYFILDCGTGLRMLGNQWIRAEGDHPIDAHVLVTHYHWDHIQGIPFFHPFYLPQNRFCFYSFRSKFLGSDSLRQVLEAQLAEPYFPVNLRLMRARREFHEIAGGDRFEIQGTRITARWLNHPQGCLGYRFETFGGTIVYATDNEPGDPALDESLRQLAAGADLLINDAQCSPEQLASSRKGWGHSTWLEGVKLARESGAKNLILFHHDPDSNDRTVDGYLFAARQEFPATWAATDGMAITVRQNKVEVSLREARVGQRRSVRFPAQVSGQTVDGQAFEESAEMREVSLRGAYLVLSHRPQLQSQMRILVEAGDHAGTNTLALNGTVVHCEAGPNKGLTGVGVVFVEDTETGLPLD